MYAAERQQRILTEARRAGRVEVAALADSLGVAAETVRRDLTVLERRGSLRRVHGGAIPVERLELEPTLADRSGRLADVKRRIAARVLDELPTGGTVLLDSGSTTQAVVQLLPPCVRELQPDAPAILNLQKRNKLGRQARHSVRFATPAARRRFNNYLSASCLPPEETSSETNRFASQKT